MFRGRYKPMFFSSISKWKGNLHTNTCAAYCCFPVLTYARKYCNLSPVTSTEDVVPRFTPASIRKNATCHKIAAKKMHDTADANGNQRYRQPIKARRKISFRRIPSKNVMKIM